MFVIGFFGDIKSLYRVLKKEYSLFLMYVYELVWYDYWYFVFCILIYILEVMNKIVLFLVIVLIVV